MQSWEIQTNPQKLQLIPRNLGKSWEIPRNSKDSFITSRDFLGEGNFSIDWLYEKILLGSIISYLQSGNTSASAGMSNLSQGNLMRNPGSDIDLAALYNNDSSKSMGFSLPNVPWPSAAG